MENTKSNHCDHH